MEDRDRPAQAGSDVVPGARRWLLRGLLLAYPLLLLGALLSRRDALSAAAGVVLVSLLLWPGLVRRSVAASVSWLVAAGTVVALSLIGHADLALLLIPVAINAALAVLFARTLRHGGRPLVARAIVAIEGEARLALPGIATYARNLTLAWSLLCASLGVLLLLAALLAVPRGILDSAGASVPFALPRHVAVWAGQIGVYLVISLFFIAEFLFRTWHFRHLPHPSLRQFMHNLARNWNQVLLDPPKAASGTDNLRR